MTGYVGSKALEPMAVFKSSAEFLQQTFGIMDVQAAVVGGTGVLGGAIAETLAYAGAKVLICGRNKENGTERVQCIHKLTKHCTDLPDHRAQFFRMDATQQDDWDRLANSYPNLGILVNAQGMNAASDFFKADEEVEKNIMNLNYESVKKGCRTIGKNMVKRSDGCILNISSVSAHLPLSLVHAYSASKAAVVKLTQGLAGDWAQASVRVNTVTPGFFPAEQNRKILTPERTDAIMEHTPAKRFGDPEELATAVLFLVSPRSTFVTGADICVDGGFTKKAI